MSKNQSSSTSRVRLALLAFVSVLTLGCTPAGEPEAPDTAAAPAPAAAAAEAPLAPIRVSGSYWIELSPVLVAANSFYPEQLTVGEGGLTTRNSGASDLATK